MKENIRLEILEGRKTLEKENIREKEILNEIKELVKQLEDTELVSSLKRLGNEYLEIEESKKNIIEKENKMVEHSNNMCGHPILCRMGYVKHNDSNRIVKAFKEDAEYSKVKCLECGKISYTMGKNDGNEDWEYYIHTPLPLLTLGVQYIERPIIEIPQNLSFKDIYNYYQEELLNGTERETVIKVLKKFKNE